MMTKYTKAIGALAATTMLMGGYAKAELEGEINVGYTNMYEFRFVDLGQDLISAGADIAYDFGGGWAMSAGAWYGSVNDANNIRSLSFNELDLYAGISKEFGPVDVEVGYIFYHFLDVPAIDTQEIYGSVSTEFGGGFGFNMTAFYDIQRWDGLYVNGEFTYSLELSDCCSLDLAAGAAYADGAGLQVSRSGLLGPNPGSTADGFQGWYASASLPWTATDHLTVTPFIKYTNADNNLSTNLTDNTTGQDYFIAGCSLAVSF